LPADVQLILYEFSVAGEWDGQVFVRAGFSAKKSKKAISIAVPLESCPRRRLTGATFSENSTSVITSGLVPGNPVISPSHNLGK